ncbi:MAG: Gldg family protein [Saprospiraceae bacterium]|nr:Gldg family protein [Saprospiraceae bacterium]
MDKGRSEFKDLLGEYASLSKGQLEYQFMSPNSDSKLEEEAMKEGIQPVLINVRDKDQAKQLKAFMGAIVEIDSKKKSFL